MHSFDYQPEAILISAGLHACDKVRYERSRGTQCLNDELVWAMHWVTDGTGLQL
jgi:hypothetical protein